MALIPNSCGLNSLLAGNTKLSKICELAEIERGSESGPEKEHFEMRLEFYFLPHTELGPDSLDKLK